MPNSWCGILVLKTCIVPRYWELSLWTDPMDWSFGLVLWEGPVGLVIWTCLVDWSCGWVCGLVLMTGLVGWPLWTGPVDWSYGLVLWTGPVFWSFGLVQWTCETGPVGWSFGLACGVIVSASPSDLFCELDLWTGPAWGLVLQTDCFD